MELVELRRTSLLGYQNFCYILFYKLMTGLSWILLSSKDNQNNETKSLEQTYFFIQNQIRYKYDS